MFAVLPASSPPASVKPQWFTTSVATHAAVIAFAIVATQAALDAALVMPPDNMILVFVPKPEPGPPPVAKPENAAIIRVADPPPRDFRPWPLSAKSPT